jgi:E3 ubiquitin-protein ligase BRE1
MREYKRERDTLESQLKDVQKKSLEHDDHLRIVDAWWTQVISPIVEICDKADPTKLLDEVSLLATDELPESDADSQYLFRMMEFSY